MKFKFIKANRQNLYEQMEGLDVQRLRKFLASFKDGEKLDMIIRKEIKWDISKMRKFFEGPTLDFLVKKYNEKHVATGKGKTIGKSVLREALKVWHIGYEEGSIIPISTMTLDFEGWKGFLKQINMWSIGEFECELPTADESDIE